MMPVDHFLNEVTELTDAADSRRYSGLELERAAYELSLVSKRLSSGEYQHASFQRNVLNIPDRAAELVTDLQFLEKIGRIWETIFRAAGVRDDMRLLDVGCGFLPKVELGLFYAGFRGEVTLLDSCEEALERACQFLSAFNAGFSTRKRSESLWDSAAGSYDFICANHLIDDLVLDAYCSRNAISLSSIYDDEQAFRQSWEDIIAHPSFAFSLMSRLGRYVSRMTPRNNGGLLLLDYPSHSHLALDLDHIFRLVSELQKALRASLKEHGFSEIEVFETPDIVCGRTTVPSSSCLAFRR